MQKQQESPRHAAAKGGFVLMSNVFSLATDGEIIVSPEQNGIIHEIRERREAGKSLKSIAAWLRDERGVMMSSKGIHRLASTGARRRRGERSGRGGRAQH
jgi:hypothetical protein